MGAIYLLDEGYVDFFRLFNHIHKNGAFFVTRAKDNMLYEVVESRGSDPEAGIISDKIIKLTGVKQSLYTISQTLGFVLFEKVPINHLFNKNQNSVSTNEYPNLFSMS